jgi:AraC-like DNA-binding protein
MALACAGAGAHLNLVMYREHAISPALQAAAACTWEHSSSAASEAYVVPDACVDVLWNGAQLLVAGPDTRPTLVSLQADTHICGLRFLPGAAGTLLGVPASAIRDARVELSELWGERARVLQGQIERSADPAGVLAQLEAALLIRMRESGPVDSLALAVADALRPSPPVPSIAQLSAALGVSERQLLRRCDAAFGYGPKLLARVLRFQAFVRALPTCSRTGLAELALSLGYADQAHLAHDTAELAGRTPSQLRARWTASESAR